MIYKKTCPICGKEFGAIANTKYCSDECRRIRDRRRSKEYYQKNKEKVLARQHKHYAEFRDEIREYKRQWAKDNSDKIREYNQRKYEKSKDETKKRVDEWRKNNPERAKKAQIKWQRNNPDKMNLYNEKNKARKYRKYHHITENYCRTHNDCLNCPYPYDVCLFE